MYRPCLNDIGLDVEEGSGDSEDASVECGATREFAKINFNSSQGTLNQNSGQKRKRASDVEKKTKKKVTPSSTIVEVVNVIAETCKTQNDVMNNVSIGGMMSELWIKLQVI
jgi:hypothetical protein